MLIERLGLPAAVGALFAYVDERWDGKGPIKIKGEDTPLAMRIPHVARDIDVQRVLGGPQSSFWSSFFRRGAKKQCRSTAFVLLL